MAVRPHNPFCLPHRREPYPHMVGKFSPSESYPIINVSYLAERYGYSDYMFQTQRPIFHSYFEAERIPFRREMPVLYCKKHPNTNNNRPIKFRRNGMRKKDSSESLRKKSDHDVWNIKSPDGVHPLKGDNLIKAEEDPVTVEENLEKFYHVDSQSSVLIYCLDRHTQHTIRCLQNNFRLTNKYRSFVMYELPQISDFKPTPAATTYKFHDRFKCMHKELLDVNDLNVNSNLDLENSVDNKKKENAENEKKKDLFSSPPV